MSYIYEKDGEYKGFGKRDKYKPRIFKITKDGIFECYEKKKCRININLLKEPWGDLKDVAGEGKNCKSCWEFQYSGKTYNFASSDDGERAHVVKQLKEFYDKQQFMNNAIASSGKYNRDQPNNDDFKEVQSVFENSTSDEFGSKKNARSKAAAQYWKIVKKDPYWKRDLYLLKEKHLANFGGGGGASAAGPVDDEKKDDTPAQVEAPKQEAPKQEAPKEKKKGGRFGRFKAAAASAAANASEAAKNAADKAKEAATKKEEKKEAVDPNQKDYGYSGKKPNNDVFQDIQNTFEKSSHSDFQQWDEKKRTKECAQFWKQVKKDKHWIKTMNEFRAKHEGLVLAKAPTMSFADMKSDIDGLDPYTDLGANANPFSLLPAEEKKEEAEPNQNPLMPCTLDDLLKEDIGTFTSQLGAQALNIQYDLIASNEFCQIGIGMGLVKGEDEEEEEEEDDDTPAGWAKKRDPDGKVYFQNITTGEITWSKATAAEYKINKRPMDDDDDLVPNVTHDGTVGKTIQFTPEDRDFTIAFEIKCGKMSAGNTLFSNGKFEYVAPRPGSKRVAVRLVQKDNSELQNVGDTILSPNVWYHVVIVCYRANDEDKRPKTDFRVFVNGVADGEISIKKESGGGILSSLGGLFGKKKKKVVEYTPTIGASPLDGSKFYGAIHNVKIFYTALEHNQVKKLAYNKENHAYMQPSMISYNKNSLRVAVPKCDMRYHGPDVLRLPKQFQTFQPDKYQSFTICAWIFCNRIAAANGSVILTNINSDSWDNTGFEFVCPTNKSHVIGLRCSNSSDILPVGTREIKINKFYHIAITVERVITRGAEPDQTDIAVYVNGKNDGTYNFKKCKDYFSEKGFWTVGHNSKNEQGTRFDGSIGDVKIFFKALKEAEVACVYASCSKERKFKRKHTVYYLSKSKIVCPKCKTNYDDWATTFCGQCGTDLSGDGGDSGSAGPDIDISSRQTFMPNSEWRKAEFQSIDFSNCTATVQDLNNSQQKKIPMNEVIPADEDLLEYEDFIPGTESQRVSNLGGMIHGEDFEGSKFKVYSTQSSFLKYICRPSSMSSLCDLVPFQKHEFQQLIDNNNIDNKYILNRLLYASYTLLKDINGKHVYTEEEWKKLSEKEQKEHDKVSKEVWKYFNEFILQWKIWDLNKNEKKKSLNFIGLQDVATTLQAKYKKMQLELFDKIKEENPNWKIFDLADFGADYGDKPTGIKNRQNEFGDDAIGNECDQKMWSMVDEEYGDEKNPMTEYMIYDKKVSTMKLWGRCFVLQEPFQKYFSNLYAKTDFKFAGAGIKSYERMMEKAIEYRTEDNMDHPAGYSICDINRCSIKCKSLDDVMIAYKILCDCPDSEVKVARIKNRFLPSHNSESTGGYRDMLVNVLFRDANSGLAAIGEVQFHLTAYEYIKHLQHKYYKVQRAVDYKSLLRNYEARKFE